MHDERSLENNQHQQGIEQATILNPGAGVQTAPSLLRHMLHKTWPDLLEDDDLELLDVSLYHLFHNLDLLIQEILPQLAEISAQDEAAQAMHDMHARQIRKHHVQVWLDEVKHRLERIKALRKIIAITISYILIAIDTNKPASLQKSPQQKLYADTHEQQPARTLTIDEYSHYAQSLEAWQSLAAEPHKLQAFSHLFADIDNGPSSLEQLDKTLVELYGNAQAVFVSIRINTAIAVASVSTLRLMLHQLLQLFQCFNPVNRKPAG